MNTGEASKEQPGHAVLAADTDYIFGVWGMPTDPADFRRALMVAWRFGRSSGIDYSLEVMRGTIDHAR